MTNTLPVTWHQDRITGCVQRAGQITNATDPDQACTIDWLDLACLTDMARTWLRDQEEPEPPRCPDDEQWCPHPECFDHAHLDSVHTDERGHPFHLNQSGAPGPDLGDDPDGDLDGSDYPPFPAGIRSIAQDLGITPDGQSPQDTPNRAVEDHSGGSTEVLSSRLGYCNRAEGHDGPHDPKRTEVTDTTQMCGTTVLTIDWAAAIEYFEQLCGQPVAIPPPAGSP